MTADRESKYWKTNKDWYRINANGDFELTEKAPERARKSFALFTSPRASEFWRAIGEIDDAADGLYCIPPTEEDLEAFAEHARKRREEKANEST